MNNVRRLLGSTVSSTTQSEAHPPMPSEPSPQVEKGTTWMPQIHRPTGSISTIETNVRAESDRNRDPSSSNTVGVLREGTPPLFSTPGASTSSAPPGQSTGSSRPAQSRISPPASPSRKRNSPPPSPHNTFDIPVTAPLRSRSANQTRPSPITRRVPATPTKAYSAPSRSPRTPYANHGESVHSRDDLLMMLLSSQAVLESRNFEVLSAEEVEELKTEKAFLVKRLTALSKKVILETKMRDAASKLSGSTSKRNSAKTDQFAEANAKAEAAQRELLKATERAATIDRRLLEHRAAVLAHTVRTIEERSRQTQSTEAGDSSDNGTLGTTISGELSPVSTAPTSLSVSSRTKFEGPHLFAGHSDAILPSLPRPLPTWKELDTLQEQLRSATEAAEVAKVQAAEYMRELSVLKLDQVELESKANVEMQRSEETITKLEKDLLGMREMHSEIQGLRAAMEAMERENATLTQTLRQRSTAMATLGIRPGSSASSWSPSPLDSWDEDIAALREELLLARQAAASLSKQSSEELETGRSTLADVARSLNIVLPGSISTIPALAAALATHVSGLQGRVDQHARSQSHWDAERLRLENELKGGMETQRRLLSDVEEARRDRDELRSQLREVQRTSLVAVSLPPSGVTSDAGAELDRVTALLQRLWAQLPSVEARAKLNAKNSVRSPPKSPKSPSLGHSPSISELDVRSLKSLYDSPSMPTYPNSSPKGSFTVESFVERVNSLLVDDKAIVERLIRMASGHELLKTNAERARKLALDSSQGLETYQKQVKMLEERNAALVLRNTTLLDESAQLQDAVERTLEQKQTLEAQATQQAQLLEEFERARKDLDAAKKTLTTRVETLEREAKFAHITKPESSSGPNTEEIAARKKLEEQLAQTTAELNEAKDELTRISMAESSQRIQLLDELNTLQQENGELRNQLRAHKK